MTTKYRLPAQAGTPGVSFPTQAAERCVAIAADNARTGRGRFAVMVDHHGRVWVDRLDRAVPSELIATITRASDPDWLADEIADAWVEFRKEAA